MASDTSIRWRPGTRAKVRAPIAYAELERIRQRHNGELRPAQIVAESRPASAPLHPMFEWSDTRAAALYREQQAAYIVRRIEVVSGPGQQGPEYVNVVIADDEGNDRLYVPVSVAITDRDYRQQVLSDALQQLKGWQARFSYLSEFGPIARAIRAVEKRLHGKRKGEERGR